MSHDTRTAALSTGVRLPYVEHGDPAGVPVIFLHGYSDSLRSFDLLLPELPASVHAYAVTQRGHGDADRPERGYGSRDYAADVVAFMDAMGLDAAVVAGHSGGSYATQRFAVDHPERTLGIVLIGAFRAFHDNPGVLELWEAVSQMTDPVDPGFVRDFQESCVAQEPPPGFLDVIVAESRKLPARVWRSYLASLLEEDVPTESGAIMVPTLMLWGDRDAFCPRSDQDALVAAIPGAQLSVYEGTGHCPHWEQPRRVAAELGTFVRRVATAPAAA